MSMPLTGPGHTIVVHESHGFNVSTNYLFHARLVGRTIELR